MRTRPVRAALLSLSLVVSLVSSGAGLAVGALPAPSQVTRPVSELFGRYASYGIAGDGVNTATGNFTRSNTDLAFGVGLLGWTRTYNSLDTADRPLGHGWSTTFSAHLDLNSDGSITFHNDDARAATFLPDGYGGYRRPAELDADLSRSANGGFALSYRSGKVWNFDVTGGLTNLTAEGQTITLTRDAQGRLATATHSNRLSLTMGYGADGHIAQVTASDGRRVSYTYSLDGRLATVTAPDGAVTHYDSTVDGRISAITDPAGTRLVANTYDTSGRVIHQDTAAGGAIDISYNTATAATTATITGTAAGLTYLHDTAGRLIQVNMPGGSTVTRSYDAAGRITGMVTGAGLQLAVDYDAHGNVLHTTSGTSVTAYVYDAANRVLSVTAPDGAITRYGYVGDSRIPTDITNPNGAVTHNDVVNGLLMDSVDALAAKTAYGYDAQRHLSSVTDPTGQTTSYGYNAAGNRTTVTSPLGLTRHYAYDGAGRLVAQTDPAGAVTKYHYSASGQLLDTTDPNGAVTRNAYNAAGNRTSSTDPLGRNTSYTYDGNGNVLTSTDPAGGVSRYTYDGMGRAATVTDPTGVTVQYTYDADGNRRQTTLPTGTEATSRDNRGNVTATTDAAGRTTRYQYDSNNREIARTDPTGAVWKTSYDAAGRVIARTDPTGAITKYAYDANGRLIQVIDPLGDTTSYQYDAAGRRTAITNPDGGVTKDTYDADGRLTAETTAAGLVTSYQYDTAGHVIAITDPRGGVTKIGYSPAGQKTATTAPTGAVRQLSYDAAGQLVAATDPNGGKTTYGYDAAGNLTTLTNAKGATTTFSYDAAGHETLSTDPLGRKTTRTYDASGNLISVTDPDGKAMTMAYDAVGELLKRTGFDGATVSYGYDADGRRTSMVDATGTTGYAYDPAGRLLTVTEPGTSTFTAAYDAAGRRTQLRYPDGLAIDYHYDPASRLIGLHDPKAGDATYTNDPDGRLLTEQLPDRWSRSYTYTGGLLNSFAETREGVSTGSTTFTRDADGRIATQVDIRPSVLGPVKTELDYRYDPGGQLLSALNPLDPSSQLLATYDAVGNRTSITHGNVQTALTYDTADELIATDTGLDHTGYTYDSSGRLVQQTDGARQTSITYNSFGRQATTTRTRPGFAEAQQATYNGDGLLTTLVTGAGLSSDKLTWSHTVHYRWSADAVPQVLTQQDEGGGWRWSPVLGDHSLDTFADFVYGAGRVFADSTHSANFSRDAFGSTLQTPGTGPWSQADSYDVFGNPQHDDFLGLDLLGNPAPADPRFGYRGELAGDSAINLRARTYDATVGRFTTRDPVTVQAGQADPVSPYAYATNDPLDFSDPLGQFSLGASLSNVLAAVFGFLQSVNGCPDPGNSIERHNKCFQGQVFGTRGYIPSDCLDADPGCLDMLWHNSQPERAAQAFTLNELNHRRENLWDKMWEGAFGTTVSKDVDWEVGPPANYFDTFRIDIVTEEKSIYEVKRWTGPATESRVELQIQGYLATAGYDYNVYFQRGKELQDWANTFQVSDGFWDFLTGGLSVFVWGFGNLPGHIYFAEKNKTPERVREKVYNDHSPIPIPIPIPIPVPVPV